ATTLHSNERINAPRDRTGKGTSARRPGPSPAENGDPEGTTRGRVLFRRQRGSSRSLAERIPVDHPTVPHTGGVSVLAKIGRPVNSVDGPVTIRKLNRRGVLTAKLVPAGRGRIGIAAQSPAGRHAACTHPREPEVAVTGEPPGQRFAKAEGVRGSIRDVRDFRSRILVVRTGVGRVVDSEIAGDADVIGGPHLMPPIGKVIPVIDIEILRVDEVSV